MSMGVYIKGMEMPTTCGKCRIKNAIECDRWKLVRSVMLDRHSDCPLVSVSEPHGDLIDRKALLEGEGRYFISLCKEGIDVEEILRAKTVISASEEVYDKYTDTVGNFHWCGTHSGEHIIKAKG